MITAPGKLQDGVRRWAVTVATNAGTDTARDMRKDPQVPQGDRTGGGRRRGRRLVNAIRSRPGPIRGDRIVSYVEAPVIQAATTDKGARPHVIRPRRRGGLLVFYWPKAGGVVAFRKVNHPGNAPGNWWRPVLERNWSAALRRAARRTPL